MDMDIHHKTGVYYGPQDGDWGNKVPPIVMEDQVRDHLRNQNIHKSMGPDEMHLRILLSKLERYRFERWTI